MDNVNFYNSFLFNTPSFQKSHYTDMRGGIPKHYLALMLSGHSRIVAENARIEADAGELFYIPKGLCYQSFWESDTVVSWHSLGFDVFPDSETRRFRLQKIECGEKEKALAELIAKEKNCTAVGLLYELLGTLLPKMKTESGKPLVSAAERVLKADLRCSADELAKACGMSVSGFYARFLREAGTTPNEFRKTLIVQNAEELLRTTDLSVEQISERLGFSSSSYFRKVLFAKTGKTPTAIRKNSEL